MRTVGSLLREERIKQGLTLEMVSVDTRISLSNLEAIEADNLAHFTSPFFYKSFVKQFASSLQVTTSDYVDLLGSQAGAIPIPAVPGQESRTLPNVPALKQTSGRSGLRWAVPAASLLVVLVGCSGVYAWWENNHSAGSGVPAASMARVPPPATHSVVAPPKEKTAATERAKTDSDPKTDSALVRREPASRETVPAGAIRLQVAAVERTWVSVVSDGKNLYSGILDKQEIKTFEGHETARIKTGNAGGVHVVFNGRIIGVLGPRGQVRTVVFTPDNFEIVDPAAHVEFTKVSRLSE